MTDLAPRTLLRALFDEGVRAVSAEQCIPPVVLDGEATGRTVVLAVGKAAAAMASVVADRVAVSAGLVVTRHGHAGPLLPPGFELIEAGHPLPDDRSVDAARQALAMTLELGPGDRLLALVSGGGSALLTLPVPGVTLADKQAVTRALLRSGATIGEINSIRKHLSLVKGGRLAVAAAPARVTTLIISDVPGDDPSFVASGPTVADQTTLAQARGVVARYAIDVPNSVTAALADPANETPPVDAPGLADGDVRVIATARQALDAAGALARQHECEVIDLGDDLQAEARQLGSEHAALALRLATDERRRVILSGGETTVSVRNAAGRGGRNGEYLLSLAIGLDGAAGIHAIACDTDGIDGTEANAGALLSPDTLARAAAAGLDAGALLDSNDAYSFFAALDDLVVTGPTRTNVNDLRAILIEGEA